MARPAWQALSEVGVQREEEHRRKRGLLRGATGGELKVRGECMNMNQEPRTTGEMSKCLGAVEVGSCGHVLYVRGSEEDWVGTREIEVENATEAHS